MKSTVILPAIAAACVVFSATASVQAKPATPPAANTTVTALQAKLKNPNGGLMIVAHRGCHAPAPYHGLSAAPENSLLALDHCIRMGIDIVEVDVRRTADGHLVMVHDNSMERTTGGTGLVSDLTLDQVKAMPLRDGLGGKDAELTSQVTPTLQEFLNHARGRILINLDIKGATYGDDEDRTYREVGAVVERLKMNDHVIIKTSANPDSPPFAQQAPFNRISYMPMISSPGDEAALVKVIEQQASGRIKPVAYEVPPITQNTAEALVTAAHRNNGRLWANSLWQGKIKGVGGDIDALRHPDKVWGHFIRTGITMIQTDEPEALLRFAKASEPGPA